MLLNYSAGIAGEALDHRMVDAFGVWWRIGSRYIHLAYDLRSLTLRDRYDPGLVAEVNVDPCAQDGDCNQLSTIKQWKSSC